MFYLNGLNLVPKIDRLNGEPPLTTSALYVKLRVSGKVAIGTGDEFPGSVVMGRSFIPGHHVPCGVAQINVALMRAARTRICRHNDDIATVGTRAFELLIF